MAGRLRKEYADALKNLNKDIKLSPPNPKNLYLWHGYIQGPSDTPYDGGSFQVELRVPQDYPMKPPKCFMKTRIFHPNIHFETGEICLDIIKTEWSPVWTLEAVCRAVLALLSSPDPSSPLNCDAGNILRAKDEKAYYYMAKMYTLEYAMNHKKSGSILQ